MMHLQPAFTSLVLLTAVIMAALSPAQAEAALSILDTPPVSDADLTNAALGANPILDEPE